MVGATLIDRASQSRWRSFAIIFLVAFALRVLQLRQIPASYVTPNANWELGAIAISLMEDGQFANPYMIATGPTAHLPPLYPAIMSLIYRAFGLTPAAGYASFLFVIVTGSLLYAMLPWFSDRLGLGRQAGFIGGVAGAVLVEWPGHGEYLTAIVMGLLLLAFLQRWRRQRDAWGRSLLLGLAIGAAFHLQPALLTVVAGCMLFELWWMRGRQKWASLGVLVLGMALACIPWAWRNYQTFGTVFFIRSNLGLELRMGNHEGAAAAMEVMDAQDEPIHPRTHFTAARELRESGEIAYMRQAAADARAWIGAHPAEFLRLTALRAAHVWFGPLHNAKAAAGITALTLLALFGIWRALPEQTIPQRAALLIPLATYPLIYYLVAYMPRYRVPIDWLLFAAAGAAIWRLVRPKPSHA